MTQQNERLLTPEEGEVVVNKWMNEDWATRYIRLNSGHWEEVVSLIAKAQDTKTRQATLREVGQFLDDVMAVGAGDDGWDEIMEALKQGEMPE